MDEPEPEPDLAIAIVGLETSGASAGAVAAVAAAAHVSPGIELGLRLGSEPDRDRDRATRLRSWYSRSAGTHCERCQERERAAVHEHSAGRSSKMEDSRIHHHLRDPRN